MQIKISKGYYVFLRANTEKEIIYVYSCCDNYFDYYSFNDDYADYGRECELDSENQAHNVNDGVYAGKILKRIEI